MSSNGKKSVVKDVGAGGGGVRGGGGGGGGEEKEEKKAESAVVDTKSTENGGDKDTKSALNTHTHTHTQRTNKMARKSRANKDKNGADDDDDKKRTRAVAHYWGVGRFLVLLCLCFFLRVGMAASMSRTLIGGRRRADVTAGQWARGRSIPGPQAPPTRPTTSRPFS